MLYPCGYFYFQESGPDPRSRSVAVSVAGIKKDSERPSPKCRKTCRTVPETVHFARFWGPSVTKSVIFLPDAFQDAEFNSMLTASKADHGINGGIVE